MDMIGFNDISMFNLLCWVILLHVFVFQTCTITRAQLISKYFTAGRNLDNKTHVSTVNPIYVGNVRSPTQCSITCGDGCSCFGFNSNTNMCRTYTSCDSSTITVGEPGWRYFLCTGKHVCLFV
jgi:hypothetical protein